jgi:predicted  nucleic acid-binding Zn-ribbon protein
MAASNRQISAAAEAFEEAAQRLSDLRDSKQRLQDQLSAVQDRIDEQQILVAAALQTLKDVVNEP